MKAFIYEKYGSPEVLQLQERKIPHPNETEVLVKVYSFSVNPAEWHLLNGNMLMRPALGLFKPKKEILGADIAGIVEAVGSKVKHFQVGDEVFGRNDFWGLAEYVAINENHLELKPENISFDEAAAIPLAAVTALKGLGLFGKINAGDKVLINGASGGIGTFAVQLAKIFGADVTGVCSTSNMELVRSLGAENVIDYTKIDFTRTDNHYDLIIDLVGNRKVGELKRVLKPNGKCALLGFSSPAFLLNAALIGSWFSLTSNKEFKLTVANIERKHLSLLKELVESGELVSVIDRCYQFEELPEALKYLGKRRAKGKIIVKMGEDP